MKRKSCVGRNDKTTAVNRGPEAIITFVGGFRLQTLNTPFGQICPSLVSRQLVDMCVTEWQPFCKNILDEGKHLRQQVSQVKMIKVYLFDFLNLCRWYLLNYGLNFVVIFLYCL